MTELFYASYQVGGTEICVGCRPDGHRELTPEFLAATDVFISVTDRFCGFHAGKQNLWFPWIENSGDKKPRIELLFGALKSIDFYVRAKVRRIYMHCDAGTHRAPTVFGAYLFAYHEARAQEIVNSVVLHNRRQNSDPIYYLDTYLQDGGIDPQFLRWIASPEHDVLEDYFRPLLAELNQRPVGLPNT